MQLKSQQFCAIKWETVRNTAELVPDVVLKVSDDTVMLVKDFDLDEIVYGNRDNNWEKRSTSRRVEGSITGRINTRDIGHLLKGTMAQPTSVTALGATTHTFRPLNLVSGTASVQLPTFTLFHSRGAQGIYKARGCVISELVLTIGETESTFEATIMGLDEVEVTNGTEITNIRSAIAYTAPDPKFTFGNVVVTQATTYAGIGAGTTLNVKPDITITINNNVSFDMSSQSTPNAELTNFDTYAGKFEASVEMSAFLRSTQKAYFDTFWSSANGQQRTIRIDLQNPAYGVLGTSALFNTLRFNIPYTLLNIASDGGLNDAMGVTITLDGLVNTSAQGFSLETVLINTVATY